MKVGVLKEIKVMENRVSMTPAGVMALRVHGHSVFVETHAGVGAGFSNEEYLSSGAQLATADQIFADCDMVMHVKEPQPSEYAKIRPGQIVFTYLHLAADERQTKALIEAGSINIAYETVQKKDGSLPLLTPMSEVAGRMAIQQAAKHLEIPAGGKGKLLGGVPGVEPATVMIIGGGVVGINAAKIACGMGAQVYLLDSNLDRLRYLNDVMPANCITMMSSSYNIRKLLPVCDAVVGAVLVPGAKAPHLVSRSDLQYLRPGSLIVDVAIDQGGCCETSHATTHTEPTYVVDGVTHYCVANIPGAVAITSTQALTNATLPYALKIADLGWQEACRKYDDIAKGLNVVAGKVTYAAVAEAFGLPYTPVSEML